MRRSNPLLESIRKFFAALGRLITAPFRLLYWLLLLPLRAFKSIYHFLAYEPPDRPATEAIAAAIQSPKLIWPHIINLRRHLVRILVSLIITVGFSFFFTQDIAEFLARPVGGLAALKAIEVTESIGVFMRVALMTGIAVASPYIALEALLFMAPGLSARSRRLGLVGVPVAAILFVLGMAFTYFLMFPKALPFLLSILGIEAQLRPASYFKFVTGLMFWMGVAFEFPLVVFVLTAMGLIEPQFLAKQWRIAIVLMAVLAAAITPTVDPVNMALVMSPMILLYFVSIALSFLAYGRRKKASSESA